MNPIFQRPGTVEPHHIRMARSGLGISIRELAERTGMNKATIVRLEAGMPVRQSTVDIVRTELEAAGADFLISDDSRRIAVSIKNPDKAAP